MEAYELKQKQSLPLEIKIEMSKRRIIEWYEGNEGNVYVSFSGGKDSTVLLHLARSIYPNVKAVYVDTGLEFPEIREFVKKTENVVWLKPKMPFNQVVKKYGYPVVSKEQAQFIYEVRRCLDKSGVNYQQRINGNKYGRGKVSEKWKYLIDAPFEISHMCCKVMKKEPTRLFEKSTGLVRITGEMASESALRRTQYLKNGCNAFDLKRPVSKPLAFWVESDIWEYIQKFNVPYSKIYDMGYKRTGCMFCMFGEHMEKGETKFQVMAKTHPKQYDYCINKLGLGEVLDYIGVEYTPNTLF